MLNAEWPHELDKVNFVELGWFNNLKKQICILKTKDLIHLMGKESLSEMVKERVNDEGSSSVESGDLQSDSQYSLDSYKDGGKECCRVCQCSEADKRGVVALEFLGISPPLIEPHKRNGDANLDPEGAPDELSPKKVSGSKVEFKSPDGEVFICNADLEMGSCHEDTLVELGCSCKNDLALVHYSCALKWFLSHGSTVCEICGCLAKNIRITDYNKVVNSLKEYEALRERTVNGEPDPAQMQGNTGVDPDALAAIRRQRLSEISWWFGPLNNNNNTVALSQVVSEQPSNTVSEGVFPAENSTTRWAVEGTGILLATGLLTVTLAWLIAPRVGKQTARSGLHILLGGICALTVVVFFRFFVLTRIKYGPARYWAILFIFWFLVFGIWASRTHGAHPT